MVVAVVVGTVAQGENLEAVSVGDPVENIAVGVVNSALVVMENTVPVVIEITAPEVMGNIAIEVMEKDFAAEVTGSTVAVGVGIATETVVMVRTVEDIVTEGVETIIIKDLGPNNSNNPSSHLRSQLPSHQPSSLMRTLT